jgi:hypothetical protein
LISNIENEKNIFCGVNEGNCVFCNLPLTDTQSIILGYGKTCAENHGMRY